MLHRRVKSNRLINTFNQAEPEANVMETPHSLPILRVSTQLPSIVDRLAARSVTGQSLQIHVHQHFVYRLHLVWNGGSNSMETYRFMEWRFLMNCEIQTFCLELCKFGLEGLCACVYGNDHSFIPAKAPPCHRGPFYPTQNIFYNLSGG
jgi:hypothetical protein